MADIVGTGLLTSIITPTSAPESATERVAVIDVSTDADTFGCNAIHLKTTAAALTDWTVGGVVTVTLAIDTD